MAPIDQRSSRNNISLVKLSACNTVRIFYYQVSAEFRKSARCYYTVLCPSAGQCTPISPTVAPVSSETIPRCMASILALICPSAVLPSLHIFPSTSHLLSEFDWSESIIQTRMQEVSKAIPISLAMLRIAQPYLMSLYATWI